MPASLGMDNSNLAVANDIKSMDDNTIYIVIASLEKAIYRRRIANISKKKPFSLVVWADDVLVVVSNNIGWPIMTYTGCPRKCTHFCSSRVSKLFI